MRLPLNVVTGHTELLKWYALITSFFILSVTARASLPHFVLHILLTDSDVFAFPGVSLRSGSVGNVPASPETVVSARAATMIANRATIFPSQASIPLQDFEQPPIPADRQSLARSLAPFQFLASDPFPQYPSSTAPIE